MREQKARESDSHFRALFELAAGASAVACENYWYHGESRALAAAKEIEGAARRAVAECVGVRVPELLGGGFTPGGNEHAREVVELHRRVEGFFGRMKNEMFYGRDWSGVTIEEFMGRIVEYIERYNAKRIKHSLGRMSPMDTG